MRKEPHMKTYRRWRTTFLGLFSATSAALILTTIVGHGQNTASGQRFAEPSVPAPRDAASNLAMKILVPFTVASVGDVMVKRTGASLEAPPFQSLFKRLRDAGLQRGVASLALQVIKE